MKIIQDRLNNNLCALFNNLNKSDDEILFQYAVRTGYLVKELKLSNVVFWDIEDKYTKETIRNEE